MPDSIVAKLTQKIQKLPKVKAVQKNADKFTQYESIVKSALESCKKVTSGRDLCCKVFPDLDGSISAKNLVEINRNKRKQVETRQNKEIRNRKQENHNEKFEHECIAITERINIDTFFFFFF